MFVNYVLCSKRIRYLVLKASEFETENWNFYEGSYKEAKLIYSQLFNIDVAVTASKKEI